MGVVQAFRKYALNQGIECCGCRDPNCALEVISLTIDATDHAIKIFK